MKIGPINFSIKSVLPPVIYDSIKKPITPPQKFVSKEIGSFSQYNEDLLVDVLLNCKKNGFYVDVGANNPSILSNTKRFYDRGWKGINIEPNPELYKEFVLERKRDVNLNIGVGNSSDKLPFYVMSANTLSSFDKSAALEGGKYHNAQLEKVIEIEVRPLKTVLKEHNCVEIDFLSVDTEGYDYKVIESNDWSIWRPKIVIVETNQDDGGVYNLLISKGYELLFDNLTNAIYAEKDFLKIYAKEIKFN